MKAPWILYALALLLVPLPRLAGEQPAVVPQKTIGPMACGPCALLNALNFGGKDERAAAVDIEAEGNIAKVQKLIEDYGHVPSDVYPDRQRYREKGGMSDLEMLGMVKDFINDAGLKEVEGASLDRLQALKAGEHLREVHARLRRSLDAGFPPLVIIRSFVIKPVEKPKQGADPFEWWGKTGHWLAVIDLPKKLEPGALSFTMKVADSWTGVPQDCFVYEEQFRNFTAAKGDDRKWIWPTVERPYLLVTMPALPLGMQESPWYLRSNVVLSYGIYRK